MKGRATRLRLDSTTLADRIGAVRAQAFVGREAEHDVFERFIAADSPHALWFVVGAGGVGKSALLEALYQRALARGLDAVRINAGAIAPNPPAVRHALARASGRDTFEAFCLARERPILFIDTFDAWQALEPWLYQDFLPELPGSLKIVLATRAAPGLEWRTDEGWRALMRVSQLGPLDDAASAEYLRLRGLAPTQQAQLLPFAHGMPLALAMGADAMLAGQPLDGEHAHSDVFETLSESFTRDARSAEQHEALQACAVVREMNEGLLAAMLRRDDAGELFAWLRGLSLMAPGEHGLVLHELVRDILMRDMPRRYPQRYEALAQGAFDWTVDLIERVESLTWRQAAHMSADAMYALRALPVIQHFLQPAGAHALYTDRAQPEDVSALAEMVRAHEGLESLHWFEYWQQRDPGSFYVVRDANASPRGFFCKLDMETLAPQDRDQDPLTRRLGQALDDEFSLKPGEHAPFIRFWMSAEHAQSQSAEKTRILMAINAYNLMARHLRVTAQVFADSPEWVTQARALGLERLGEDDIGVGDRRWRIFFNDWQRESPAQYYRAFAQRCMNFQRAVAAENVSQSASTVLDAAEFQAAVADALKCLHRPSALARNPLIASALVARHAGPDADKRARAEALVACLRDTAEGFSAAGASGARRQRVLQRAYFAPAGSYKQAASGLNMGYSTFRRQLAEARDLLAEELWRQELACR